jgi:hypothetical protein
MARAKKSATVTKKSAIVKMPKFDVEALMTCLEKNMEEKIAKEQLRTMKQGPHVMYVRDEKRFPMACIAYSVQDGDCDWANVFVGLSIFNPHDKFDKKLGRQRALGRMNAKLEGRVHAGEDGMSFIMTEKPEKINHVLIASRITKICGIPLRIVRAIHEYIEKKNEHPDC